MRKDLFSVVIRRVILTLIAFSLLSLLPQADVSAGYNQQTQLLPSDPTAANEMGYAVAFSSTSGIVGVPGDADRGTDSGSAYIWHFSTLWEKEAKLTAPDGGPGDRFGAAVALRSQYAVVAAPNWNSGQGAVYIYQEIGSESWPLLAILTADDGAAGDEFGASLSMGSDSGAGITRLAIGAPGQGAGAVYIFEIGGLNPTWTQISKLTPADGASGDRFGTSVYTDTLTPGTFTIVGAPNDDDAGTDSGSVYVYISDGTWSEETKLNGGDSAAGDHFGASLTNLFSSNMPNQMTLIVGAPDADSPSADAGVVYTFLRTSLPTPTWTEGEKLIASDADAGDHFGASVAHIIDEYAVIGAPGDDAKGTDAGAAYIFSYATTAYNWEEATKITGTESAAGDHYGASVSLGEDVAVIGAPQETGDVGQAQSGTIHIHKRIPSNWAQSARLTAGHSSSNDNFGSSFAVDGNYAIVGVPGDDDGGHDGSAQADQGSAYIFFKSGSVWNQQVKLTSSDNGRATQFAKKVAISGDTALVSARTSTGGVVIVYVRNGTEWTQQARLVSPGNPNEIMGGSLAVAGDLAFVSGSTGQRYFFTRTGSSWALQNQFSGAAVSAAMDGNWAIIGNPASGADGAASIYQWDGSNWTLETTLTPDPDSSGLTMSFGFSVALNGTIAAVGATEYSDPGKSAMGAAYVYSFDGTNWIFRQLLKRSSSNSNDGMGTSVSLEGSRIIAGMSAPQSGFERAVVFRNFTGVWAQVQTLTQNASTNDYGQTVSLRNGTLWVTAPSQTISGAGAAGTLFAYQYTPDTDLSIALTDVPGVVAGFDMTYEFTVTNNGQENATGISVVDTLPANVTFLNASPGCSHVGNVVTCNITSLNIGASQARQINVNVNATASGTLTNQVTISSSTPVDLNPANDSATQDTEVVPSPAAPTLVSPADGSSTTITQPTFTWNPVSGITVYDVQLDVTDPPQGYYRGFNVGTTFKPPAPLLYMTYYWRVRSVDDFGIPSPWSETRTLIVNALNAAAPVRGVSNSAFPTLRWAPISWAINYQVEIGADKDFKTATLNSGPLPGSVTSYTSPDGLPNGTWYWRVRAYNGLKWSAWSATETIQIINQ